MTVHILELPSEILFMIFSWVPSRDLVTNLPRVCKALRDILHTEWYWRTHYVRLTRSQPWIEPCSEGESVRVWQEGCLESEFALSTAAASDTMDVNTLTGE